MGAYTCQFGTVHKMCRCPTPDKCSETRYIGEAPEA